MRKFFFALLLVVVVYACSQFQTNNSNPSLFNLFCNAGGDEPCSQLPFDVDESFGIGYDSFLDSLHQPPFDVFSWQTFIALNWPADSTGHPMKGSIGDNTGAPRVWEFYKDPAEVFNGPSGELLFHLGNAKASGEKFLYMDSKSPHLLVPMKGFEEADGHPLIDRNLNFALYEIKMNPSEYEFVKKFNLTTVSEIGQYYTAHHNQFELPTADSASGNDGTMEIKASWRIMDVSKGDDTSRYYCRNAVIYIDSLHTTTGKPLVVHAKVGLVGMHIIRKTAKLSTKMIWSTFEHVDNTPDSPQEAQMNNSTRWSFYNPACLNCIPNNPAAHLPGDNDQYLWSPVAPYAGRYAVKAPGQSLSDSFGTQAVRVYPIYSFTEQVNELWRGKLSGTVWANYRLIGSQWQLSEINPSPTAPNYLANTTLETYIQASASCISCHSFASVNYIKNPGDTINVPTDLSFIFPVYAK